MNWNDFYNQWLFENELNNVVELKKKFDERASTINKRKRSNKSNFEKQSRKKQKKNN